MRQVEFRAYLSQSELKRLRQSKPAAGWTIGAVALALAWIFSAFGMSPSQLDFGTLQAGSGGRLPVQLTNRGMTEFHAASIALEGADAKDFGVDPQQSCETVRSGDTCVLWVQFRPRQAGEKHARLTVRANDGSEFSSEFKGVAAPEQASLLPPPVLPPAGTTPSTSSGGAPKDATTHSSPQPHQSAPPPISQGEGPHTPTDPAPQQASSGGPPVIPPDQSPPAEVPPQVASPQQGPPAPARQNPPTLAPPPRNPPPPPPLYAHVTMTPPVTQFSGTAPNTEFTTASARPITVINDGAADVRQLNLKIGTPGGPFSYTPSCPAYLARGQRCTVQVHFAPSDQRSHADSLSAYDGGVHLASVALNGTNTIQQPPPGHSHLTFKPREVQFPALRSDGWVTAKERVEVVSDGTADVQQLSLKMSPTGSPFGYTGNCPTHLGIKQTCILQLTFEQKSQQPYTASIAAYDGSTALASLPLRGGGNAPQTEPPHVTMTPTVLRFSGSTQYTLAYVPSKQTVVVRNDGPVDLRSLSLRLAPANAPFSFASCSPGLARGRTCTVQVNFAANSPGQSSATLSAYEGGAQLASVQLYGFDNKAAPPKSGGTVTSYVDRAYPNGPNSPSNGSGSNATTGKTQNGTAQVPKSGSRFGSQSSGNQPQGGKSNPAGSKGSVTGSVYYAYPNGAGGSGNGSGSNGTTGTGPNGTVQVSKPGPTLGSQYVSKPPNNAANQVARPNQATTVQQPPQTVVRRPPPPRQEPVRRAPPKPPPPTLH